MPPDVDLMAMLRGRRVVVVAGAGGVGKTTVSAALGLGLAETIPGRSPILDGFGLIAFTALFPIMSVMAYAQLSERKARKNSQ